VPFPAGALVERGRLVLAERGPVLDVSPVRASERRRYPINWPAISARIRFTRAAGRCECAGECGTGHGARCTARHGQPHSVTGSRVVLTTAHLDHVPEHCDDANLRAMCQRCHLAYDAGHHAATRAAAAALADRAALVDEDQAAALVDVLTAPGQSAAAAGSALLAVLVPWPRSRAIGFREAGHRCRAGLRRYVRPGMADQALCHAPGGYFLAGFRIGGGA
jgi:hypothetical protein